VTETALGASFRDPSGYLIERDGEILRRVHPSYAPHYERLMESGLYDDLVGRGLLIPHEALREAPDPDVYRTLRPERVDFISYPYEWSFSQLRDAALVTLRIQRTALRFGMTLKDASAYNVQFHRGSPILIDTLSFETYQADAPWVAYRQFCQHFLAPLALMAYRDVRLGRLLRPYLDGIPLDLARSLLPGRAWFNVHLFMHIRLHAGYQTRYQGATEKLTPRPVPKKSLENLVTALQSGVEKLRWNAAGTEWADYTDGDSYSESGERHKREVVGAYLDGARPASVWDLGANTGVYSRIASEHGALTRAFDVDPACVDRNYRAVRKAREPRLLPLLLDLSNPSPALGWAHEERMSLADRGPADLVMVLALIHHLAISNNVPLGRVAAWLARLTRRHLIVEFVPKDDPKVQVLLANRTDVFDHYTESDFEAAFGRHFDVEQRTPVMGSTRILYLMRRRD